MTLFYYEDSFLEHDTGRHPECAERLRAVMVHLQKTDWFNKCTRVEWPSATAERVARVHDVNYIEAVRQLAERGGGRIEQDTVVSNQSYDVALRAAGAVCDAVDRVVASEEKSALCIVRPPGHHALPAGAMGFCLMNNVAIGARLAIKEHELNRVLVIDWDVHHGNGTQDAFWRDEQVGFLSIHRWPFYPGTGDKNETGTGPGLGGIRNLPVQFGTSRRDYLNRFEKELDDFAERIRPELVIVSAGFDSHRLDPIGSLGLEVEDFDALTKIVTHVANEYADGKIVSVLEGGYNPSMLAQCVETHLRGLSKDDNAAK